MAHELDDAALLREPLEEIEHRIEVDRAGVLELAHKAVRRAHTGVAKSRALASVVRSRGGPGLLREREQGLFERGHVVHPVMRVEVGRLASDELAHPAVLGAVFEERLVGLWSPSA